MNWLRETLKKHRVFVLAFLLVETIYWADGLQFVYAHEIHEQEREAHLQVLSGMLGVPVEKLRGERRALFDPLEGLAGGVISSVGVSLDGLSTTLQREARRLADRLDEVLASPSAVSAEPAAYLGSPQAAGEPKSSRLSAATSEDAARERTVRASSPEPERLPLRQVERKARTEKAGGTVRSGQSSAVAPASVPRPVLQKEGVAPEIAALASSLDNSPAEIFRFVHDQIDFDPKWGAEKSPQGTLLERQGTSWDQAWLLQQLLTAAGVDARLEWGEIEIPAEMLRNITGVEDPWRAGDLMTTAGTPIVLVVEGSQVRTARMSHVWVKAHLDYIPNRGATAGPGDTWIRMDPSLKRFTIAGDLRLDTAVPYDLEEYLQSGTELSPRQFYEAALDAYVTANHPEVSSLEELKRTKSLVQEAFPFVPGTLRGKILSVQGESVEMPVSFQLQLKLEVREAGGPVLVTYEAPWPAVYGRRLELAWPGATSSDQATLDLYGGVFSTPPFEVDLKPSIRVEGVEVAAGSAIGSAEDVVVQASWTTPQGLETVVPFEMWAGEPGVLSLDFGRTPQETIDRYTEELSAATDLAEQEAWSLALAGAQYQQSVGGDLTHLAELRWQRVLNLGRTVLAVQRGAVSVSPDGTPLTFSRGPTALDLGSMPLGLFPAEGGVVSTVSTLELLGSQGSFREGEALDPFFDGDHVTGLTFLTRAVREGQTLARVDAANVDEALDAVELSAEAEANVRAGVEDGWVAWIPESQLLVDTFDATGYVLEDPATGAAGYFVTYERRVEGLDANIVFHSPQDLDVVTSPIDVVATIESEALQSWTLSYQMAGEGPTVVLATGTGPVTQEKLAVFDPTLLLNGLYDIVLTGRDVAGQSVSGKVSVVVDGDMKLGKFTLLFIDLALPLSGLDVEVRRTYDSRDKRLGDFGYGWSLDILQGSYHNNRPPGDGWQILKPSGPLGLPCTQTVETKTHLTTVRLSEHETYLFRLDLEDTATVFGGCHARAVFKYVGGPQPGSTLEILGNDKVFYENASNRVLDLEELRLFEPDTVKLTTRDGRIFHVNLEVGVTHLEDLSGNVLEVTPGGITHSSGRGIEFERDAEGRISKVIDPLGKEYLYAYDSNGDLVSTTDPLGAVTRFIYGADHYLEDVENALGVRAVRTVYDDDGRMISTTDSLGRTVTFDHDLEANREVITNRLGFTRVLEFDARGNVTSETNELGEVTLRTYDERDNLLSVTDPLGRATFYTYTAENDLATVTDPLGRVTSYTYDTGGRPVTLTDPRGGQTHAVSDAQGRFTQVTDATGRVTSLTYGDNDPLTMTDALGNVTTFEYDEFGNPTKEVDALGHAAVSTYDGYGSPLSETRTRTRSDGSTETLVTSYTYDDVQRPTGVTGPGGGTASWSYDLLGRLIQTTDEAGRVTAHTYDLLGRRLSTTFPDGTTESRSYDGEGRIVAEVDRAGRTTSFAYDAAGRLLSTTFPDGSSISNEYDQAGQLVAVTDARGNTTHFVYNAAGERTAVIDALGNSTTWTYGPYATGPGTSAAGDYQTSVTDALGQVTEFAYDALDRLTAVTYPDGTTAEIGYDVLGRKVSESDPGGATTQFGYDALGRLDQVTDALGQVTSYTYDEVGNRLTQTDANGNTTHFAYDAQGNLVRKTLPDGSFETWSFDPDATLASHTDFNGATTSFEYDADGRLARRVYPDGSDVTFTYTATGQVATVTDGRGVTAYTYDLRDRLIEKTDPTGHKLTSTYDSQGNRTSLTATVGAQSFTTTYTYDALNRLSTIIDAQGEVTTFSYDANGNLATAAFPNGITTIYAYDVRNRLTSLSSATGAGDVVQSYQVALDPSGHRARIDEHDGTSRHYGYDALHRLTQERVTDPAGDLVYQKDYAYDPVGNRLAETTVDGSGTTSVASAYDNRNRHLTAGAASYGWDANGNLTSETEGAAVTAYGWDFENRLTRVTLPDATVVETLYDAGGNRVRTTTTAPDGATTTADYLVDTSGFLSHVVAEVVDGEVETLYTLAGDRLTSLYRPASGVKRFYHLDGLGSVRALTDETGAVTDSYELGAFGGLLAHQGEDANPFLFTGDAFDRSSGLYYLRARWMDPGAGRFTAVDPFPGLLRDPATLHPYSYATGDPVNRTDRSGLFGVGVSLGLATIGLISLAVFSSTDDGKKKHHRSGLNCPHGRAPTKIEVLGQGRNHPRLLNGKYRVLEEAHDRYNCIGYSIGADRYLWKIVDVIYGDPKNGTVEISDFDHFYDYFGYTRVWSYRAWVVLYALTTGEPKHAAKRHDPCTSLRRLFESKMGWAGPTYVHRKKDLEGGIYGYMVRFYKKTKKMGE